jgi:hypothetical protein
MRIVYHLGAHCTDEDRLVRCLLKNRAVLAEQGIAVPSPTRYRSLLRDTATQLRGRAASADTQSMLLDEILEDPTADRLILSWTGLLSFPAFVMQAGFYAFAGERLRAFTRIFPDAEAEFCLGIRNPATFLPDLQQRVNNKGRGSVLEGVHLDQLRWAEVIRNIRAHCPGIPLTVWCDEETPLIWPEVLQAVAGFADGTSLIDTDEVLTLIMSEIGLGRMKAYCDEHPPQTVVQRRRIVTAFLEKFAKAEVVQQEIDVPDWTAETVQDLTDQYMEDVALIRTLPGVQMIEA